jgi:hypothetical protein
VPALTDRPGLLRVLAQFLPHPDLAEAGGERVALPRVQVLVAEEDDPVFRPGPRDRRVRLVRVGLGQVQAAQLRADQPADAVYLRHRHHDAIIGRRRAPENTGQHSASRR